MYRAAILVAALAVAIPAVARPQDDESKSLRAKLRSIRIDVDFTNFTGTELSDYIREVAGINVVVDGALGKLDTRLRMKAKNVTLHSVLSLLLKPHQIGFVVEDGVLKIAPEEKLKSAIRLEIIDVRDVMFPIQDFPGGEITLVDDLAGTNFTAAESPDASEFPIVELIKAHTGAKAWEENAQASIQLNNGLIFVRQTPEVIAQVRRVVAFLRQYK